LHCVQQTLKLPGFSLHHMTDDRWRSAGGLLQQLVCSVSVLSTAST